MGNTGWNTIGGTGSGYAAGSTFTMGSADVNLYAVWTVIPAGTMTAYSLPAGSEPYGIAFDGADMWTANEQGKSVTKIATK